jgi:hypothetical protein
VSPSGTDVRVLFARLKPIFSGRCYVFSNVADDKIERAAPAIFWLVSHRWKSIPDDFKLLNLNGGQGRNRTADASLFRLALDNGKMRRKKSYGPNGWR